MAQLENTEIDEKQSSKNFEIMKYQDLKARFDEFDDDLINLKHSLSDDEIPKVRESLKTGVDTQFDLLKDTQTDNGNYRVLWTHYHDSQDFLKNTCDDTPYEVEVDSSGYLLFKHKNSFKLDMIEDIEEDEFLTSANSTVRVISLLCFIGRENSRINSKL